MGTCRTGDKPVTTNSPLDSPGVVGGSAAGAEAGVSVSSTAGIETVAAAEGDSFVITQARYLTG